jgi:NAD(P)H-hydrate repair Nnr-like enzyme with NAD(P)H-hydrate dehydratase domain
MADNTSWLKQTRDKPLFPDIEWSKPENRRAAGKLLIVGGNVHDFAAPALAYNAAVQAGIGSAKVLLPDSTKKMLGRAFEDAEFAPSTPSGSFGLFALDSLLSLASWADCVLLAGDSGRNSETAVLHERFVTAYKGPLTITKDSLDYFLNVPDQLLTRPQTLIVANVAQLQKMITYADLLPAIYFSMDMLQFVDALQKLSSKLAAMLVTKHSEVLYVAVDGQLSTTPQPAGQDPWRARTAATASVYWLQHLTKPFEALTTAVFALHKSS